jgi:hypothetical protein
VVKKRYPGGRTFQVKNWLYEKEKETPTTFRRRTNNPISRNHCIYDL